MRRLLLAGLLLAPLHCAPCSRNTHKNPVHAMSAQRIGFHAAVLDGQGKLLPWAPFARVVELAWKGLESFPVQEDTGLPTWMTSSRFEPEHLGPINWPNNPAGLNAMLVESALSWYAFSGDEKPIALARKGVDHVLAHGLTAKEASWSQVPYASAMPGAVEYRGADDREFCGEEGDNGACGRGDGIGVVEPDKIGELGFALLRLWEHTNEPKYRDSAIDCARALAAHVRTGDEFHSPWPFRVYAVDDVPRDEYSGHVLGAIKLFDELIRLQLDDTASFARARKIAFDWMMQYPMTNDVWGGYFEDIPIYADPSDNPNQYAPMQTARWLIEDPRRDPAWREHVDHLFSFVQETFAQEADDSPGTLLGADLLSEQRADMAKMASHTARWGAVHALDYASSGQPAAKETALRALAWATYWITDEGLVKVGPDDREGWWFSDGYGDFIRHFVLAMGAVPEWAPPHEDHLVRASSVVTRVDHEDGLNYSVFDDTGDEVLRLSHAPKSIEVDGVPLETFTVTPLAADVVVRIHRDRGRRVSIRW